MKKTIVYLHGYGSSGLTGTAGYLRQKLPEYEVLTPDIPVDPQEALPFLRKYCKDHHADLVIGTSMGGMYAMQLQDYKRICVNPALRMSELTDIMKVGTHEYFQPTQSGETHFTITEDTIQHFKDMGFFRAFQELPAELGEVIVGKAEGRTSHDEKILTVNIGTGLADVGTARMLYNRAIAEGIGTKLSL